MGGQRWRVLLHEGGREGAYRIEVDDGAGDSFRPATVVEVDQALKSTTYVAERSAERKRNTSRNTRRSAPERQEHPVSAGVEHTERSTRNTERSTAEHPERSAEHQSGTPSGTAERNAEIRRRRAAGESVRTVAKALGVGVATVQRAMQG